MTKSHDPTGYARGRVAVILASALGLFLVLFTGFAVIEAGNPDSQLSENATQLLSAAIGGIVGVLAGYVGGVEAGTRAAGQREHPAPDPNPAEELEEPPITWGTEQDQPAARDPDDDE